MVVLTLRRFSAPLPLWDAKHIAAVACMRAYVRACMLICKGNGHALPHVLREVISWQLCVQSCASVRVPRCVCLGGCACVDEIVMSSSRSDETTVSDDAWIAEPYMARACVRA